MHEPANLISRSKERLTPPRAISVIHILFSRVKHVTRRRGETSSPICTHGLRNYNKLTSGPHFMSISSFLRTIVKCSGGTFPVIERSRPAQTSLTTNRAFRSDAWVACSACVFPIHKLKSRRLFTPARVWRVRQALRTARIPHAVGLRRPCIVVPEKRACHWTMWHYLGT